MSAITNERRKEILASLLTSTVCGGCGGRKKPRMSHCRDCYRKLPPESKNALYRRFGAGYEEAYEDSLLILKEKQ